MPEENSEMVATNQQKNDPKNNRRRRRHVYIARVNHISTWLKYALFLFNFIFWLGGIVVMGVAIYLYVEEVFTMVIANLALLILIPGIIIFLVSFCGCIGALRDNILLLYIYIGFLVFMLIIEAGVGIFILLIYYVPSIRLQVGFLIPESTMQNAIRDYMDDDDLRSLIDTIQSNLTCCGIHNKEGYKDWGEYNVYYNCSTDNRSPKKCGVPKSCCRINSDKIENVACGNNIQEVSTEDAKLWIYTKGCGEALFDWLKDNTTIIGIIILVVMAIQILACFLSYFYINQIKRQMAQWKYY